MRTHLINQSTLNSEHERRVSFYCNKIAPGTSIDLLGKCTRPTMYVLNVFLITYGYSTLHVLGRLYSLQRGMEIDKKSPDARGFLVALMDMLETVRNLTS